MATSGRSQLPTESAPDGSFVRQESQFRDRVTANGSTEFPAEAGRYHLYVSMACPWAHRTIIFRKLKKLEPVIGMTVVDPIRDERGWRFAEGPDPVNGFGFLSEAYAATAPAFSGRVTVPVLWDSVRKRIVNNESSEIIRMLNSEFDAFGGAAIDFYPADLRAEIDEVNARVYDGVNNGVYRCGFASSQAAYDLAFGRLFETLDWLEQRLRTKEFLVGDRVTEADWRLFTTLVRFDAVYYVHFKCNLQHIYEYPRLSAYLERLFRYPGVADTVDMDHIKRHYYVTHRVLNPLGIVPKGPRRSFPGVITDETGTTA